LEQLTGDILWVLISVCLVFLMQAGFLCLETGLTRSKNNINVAIKNLADFGLSTVLFWLLGFGLMFGSSRNGWIGTSSFAFEFSENTAWLVSFFLFQVMFCGTTMTILSGAVAERLRFGAYLIIASVVSGITYPIFGHWVWNGLAEGVSLGWLGALGFVDFAGSTVVHSLGGWAALAILLMIGPRVGRFPPAGPPQKIPKANIPLAALGVLLLFIGWLGFNGGSTLALNDQVPVIIGNTIVAGSMGLMAALLIGWIVRGRPDVDLVMNGCLAGLVAITAGVHAMTAVSTAIIAVVGALIMLLCEELLERLQIDDAVSAIPVHLAAGIWGTLAVGLFGQPDLLGTGLDRLTQTGIQFLGIIVCAAWAFGTTYICLRIAARFLPLRVTAEEEHIGLNISEHGASNELLDFFRVMDAQAQTSDLSLRVPIEPFTIVGQIGTRYNRVMDKLEAAQEISVRNERLKAENLRLGAELDINRQLQQMLLPSQDELRSIDGLDIAGFMEPADEVGGDYYDVLQHNGHVKIGIGDVTGHGLESGMLMLMTQTAVRTLLTSGERDHARFLNILNRTIYDNVQRMEANKSLSLALLDYHHSGHLRLSGQHEELIIVRQGGQVELIDTMDLGFPIGLDDDITEFVHETLIKLESGDGVVLYTDGITEAENVAGEQYGLERMCAVLSGHWHKSANAIKQAVIDDLHEHIGQQTVFDDITLLVLKQQ